MLFLLRNHRGKAVLIAQAADQMEADEYGRANVPEFIGRSLELSVQSRSQAEELWGVRTVDVPCRQTGSTVVKAKANAKRPAMTPVMTMTHVWVRGLELPEEVVEDDVLTAEDRRDLALDHISRTSQFVGRVEIRKWARG